MGGRGASSGLLSRRVVAIEVNYGGGTRSSFRLRSDGKITSIDDYELKKTNNLTISEIAERARANGYSVTTYTAAQVKELDEARAKERTNRPDYELGTGLRDNREYRRKARRDKLATRAQRRKK